VPKNATTRFIQNKLAELIVGCNEPRLVVQSFAWGWVYATNNYVTNFTLSMATNYVDCFD
jgi:hypothetical protein